MRPAPTHVRRLRRVAAAGLVAPNPEMLEGASTSVFLVRLIRSLLSGLWAALKPALTFLAWLLAVIAAVAFVNDVTLWQLSGGPFAATGLSDHWMALAPASHQAFVDFAARKLPEAIWSPLLQPALQLPVWVSLGVLALALFAITRTHHTTTVFAN